jgi:hypothetical protein
MILYQIYKLLTQFKRGTIRLKKVIVLHGGTLSIIEGFSQLRVRL